MKKIVLITGLFLMVSMGFMTACANQTKESTSRGEPKADAKSDPGAKEDAKVPGNKVSKEKQDIEARVVTNIGILKADSDGNPCIGAIRVHKGGFDIISTDNGSVNLNDLKGRLVKVSGVREYICPPEKNAYNIPYYSKIHSIVDMKIESIIHKGVIEINDGYTTLNGIRLTFNSSWDIITKDGKKVYLKPLKNKSVELLGIALTKKEDDVKYKYFVSIEYIKVVSSEK